MRLESKKNYLKVTDVHNGDTVTFLSEGEWKDSTKFTYDDGTPRKQFVVEVEYAGEIKSMTLNATNRNNLMNSWGKETKEWINKSATIELIKVSVGGQLKNSILLNPVQEVTEEPIEP